MGISIFPSNAAEFVSNNFVINMNNTANNTADTGGVKQAGPYSMSFSSTDLTFDVYLLDETGASVGYSNSTSISASGLFSTVVILGVATDEIVSFTYQGSKNDADGEGDEPGAGAYLTSVSPGDLPNIDDTATVVGGNFGADTELTFESGATVLPAKNITLVSATELLVTRPDGLIEDLAPYTLRAVNTGVTQPTGTNLNILADSVTAGADPTWVTTSPLNLAPPNEAFSQTLEAIDADGTVVNYEVVSGTLTTGLSLDAATGVLSGTSTATTGDVFNFTVRATDDGGNTTDKALEQTVALAQGGAISTGGGYQYHAFTSGTSAFKIAVSKSVDYLVVGGGGAGGAGQDRSGFTGPSGGGGGAGGLLTGTTTFSPGTYTTVVGVKGTGRGNTSSGNPGTDTTFADTYYAIGGGYGGGSSVDGGNGGSGGGGGSSYTGSAFYYGGTGVSGQGFPGGYGRQNNNQDIGFGGGGGGAGGPGLNASSSAAADGGPGNSTFTDWSSVTGIGSGTFAVGGDGSDGPVAVANTGSGGAGGSNSSPVDGFDGSDGVIIVRFAI
jgi:hypothetical protein